MREFKYKGAMVRPYEPFYYNKSERFFKGSMVVARTLLADEHPQAVIIEIETMQELINTDSNGNAKAIRACYGQCGFDSVFRGGGQGITGVMEEVEPKIAASRGRGESNRQQLEINNSGTSNTITSVNKDNLLIEPKINLVGQYDSSQNSRVIDTEGISYCTANGHKDGMPKIIEPNVLRQERTEQCKKLRKKNGDKGMKFNQGSKEYSPRTDGVSNTLSTSTKDNMLAIPELRMENGCMVDKEGRRYRIRKLTPTECFRLQDVSDEDIEKIISYRDSETSIICDANGKPIMNMYFDKPSENERKVTITVDGEQREYYRTQLIWKKKGKEIFKTNLYKLAGNSICVAPMYHIFRKLFIEKGNENRQLEIF